MSLTNALRIHSAIEKALKHNSGHSNLAFNRICRFYAFLFGFSTCLRLYREHRREISLSFFACRVTFAAKTSNSPVTHETLLMRMRRRASDEKWLANKTREIKKGFNRNSKLIYGKDFRFRGPENDSKILSTRGDQIEIACLSADHYGNLVKRWSDQSNRWTFQPCMALTRSEVQQTVICTCSRLSNRFRQLSTASLPLGTILWHGSGAHLISFDVKHACNSKQWHSQILPAHNWVIPCCKLLILACERSASCCDEIHMWPSHACLSISRNIYHFIVSLRLTFTHNRSKRTLFSLPDVNFNNFH